MKLRNKKTGEIANLEDRGLLKSDNNNHIIVYPEGTLKYYAYNSLAELNEEWEDYEEPKSTIKDVWFNSTLANGHFVEIDFINDEEAELAGRKLKAWKRLKDKGFMFSGHDDRDRGQLGDIVIYAEMSTFEYDDDSTRDDLDLLFGGEE